MGMAAAQLERRDVSALNPHPKNEEIYGANPVGGKFVESIREHGIREPLTVTPDGTIISGHRRWRAAEQLGLEDVPVRIEEYDDEVAEWEAILDHNQHRNKSKAQKLREAKVWESIYRRKNKQTQGSRTDIDQTSGSIETEVGRTDDEVANEIGVSRSTYQRGKVVRDAAEKGEIAGEPVSEEVQETAKQEMDRLDTPNEQSYHGAYRNVKEAAKETGDTQPEPTERYETHTCVVCGEEWTDYHAKLNAREGERIDVDGVCIRDWPDEIILHIPEEEFQ